MPPNLSLGLFVLPVGLSLSIIHHPLLCCYHKQAAYEAEGEVQLATEPRAPGAPTWGDTPLAVASTAGTMKAKENSKRKDTSWYPTWSYLRSIRWPLSPVQVSMCNEGRKAEVAGEPPLQALCQACRDPSRASPWLRQSELLQGWHSALPCAECLLALARLSAKKRHTVGQRTWASGSSSGQRKKSWSCAHPSHPLLHLLRRKRTSLSV